MQIPLPLSLSITPPGPLTNYLSRLFICSFPPQHYTTPPQYFNTITTFFFFFFFCTNQTTTNQYIIVMLCYVTLPSPPLPPPPSTLTTPPPRNPKERENQVCIDTPFIHSCICCGTNSGTLFNCMLFHPIAQRQRVHEITWKIMQFNNTLYLISPSFFFFLTLIRVR